MPRLRPDDHPNLFAVAPVEKPSSLSVVGDRTPKVKSIVEFGRPRRATKKGRTGRPDARIKSGASLEEECWPSRQKRRVGLRLDAGLVVKVEAEIDTMGPDKRSRPDLYEVFEEALWAWLAARAAMKVVDRTPAVVSGSSSIPEIDQDQTTTTTTTAVAWSPKSPPLPGFAAKILELQAPSKSIHSEALTLAYAIHVHSKGEGIREPKIWTFRNQETGKFDRLIEMWAEEQRLLEERVLGHANQAADKSTREERRRNCLRCAGTGTEVVPGKGARVCDHEEKK